MPSGVVDAHGAAVEGNAVLGEEEGFGIQAMLHVDEVHGNAAPVHAVLDDGRRHVAARSSAPASVVLQTHRTAVAGRSPRSIASSIAWKLVPPPEAKTAKRRGAAATGEGTGW